MIELMKGRGITDEDIATCRFFEVDFDHWLSGFDNNEDSIRSSVSMLRDHPLIPDDVRIHGFLMDSVTGLLTRIV